MLTQTKENQNSKLDFQVSATKPVAKAGNPVPVGKGGMHKSSSRTVRATAPAAAPAAGAPKRKKPSAVASTKPKRAAVPAKSVAPKKGPAPSSPMKSG